MSTQYTPTRSERLAETREVRRRLAAYPALLEAVKMAYADCNGGKYLSARAYAAITAAIAQAEGRTA